MALDTESRGKYFASTYDILAQIISVLDIATDIWVCITFHQDGRMTFFAISLTILIMALLSYTIAFVKYFDGGTSWNHMNAIFLFFLILPFSPILPFAFHYPSATESVFDRLFGPCGVEVSSQINDKSSDSASRFKQFFEQKIDKHIGFILESLIEGILILNYYISMFFFGYDPFCSFQCSNYIAFPQAILQMAAIVIYKEPNTIAIISIFISLLSVASKSFVFMMGVSNSIKQLFFNWLCAVTDFFSMFFVVCWVFYEPEDESLEDAFSLIQSVWIWKLYIFELPGVLFPAFFFYITFTWGEGTDNTFDHQSCILKFLCTFLGTTLLFGPCCIAAILAVEITCWSWSAFLLFQMSSIRLPGYNKDSLQLYFTLLKWINSAESHRIGSQYTGCISYTKQQNKIMRLCSVNAVLHDGVTSSRDRDYRFKMYLDDHRVADQYMKVTYGGLRNNVEEESLKQSQFHLKFWGFYGDVWNDVRHRLKDNYQNWKRDATCDNFHSCGYCGTALITFGSLTFIFGPLYMISRIGHLLFPWFIVLYLGLNYDVVIWNTPYIDTFQVVMITVYLVLSVILLILLYFNVKEQYLLYHILPYTYSLNQLNCYSYTPELENGVWTSTMDVVLKHISNHYFGIILVPIRRAMLIDHFGRDIGEIIASYLPNDDTFDDSENMTKVTTVV